MCAVKLHDGPGGGMLTGAAGPGLPGVSVHPAAVVESDLIGAGTDVNAFVHVSPGVRVGRNCNLCSHAVLDRGCVLEDDVTVMHGAFVAAGVTLRTGVFVGPGTVFTNDLHPRSPRAARFASRYLREEDWLTPTVVEEYASLGANVTVLCGSHIGRYAVVGAHALVTRPVPDFARVKGVPARISGYVKR